MSAVQQQPTARVIPLRRHADPKSPEALLLLARYRAAWRRANPFATVEQELAAAAEIAKELGL